MLFYFFGLIPFKVATLLLAIVFMPYIFLTLYVLQRSANSAFTFLSLAFSMCSLNIHLRALGLSLTGLKATFDVTSKKKLQGNFLYLVKTHMLYVVLAAAGLSYGLYRYGLSPSYIANAGWTLLYMAIFSQFIYAAWPHDEQKSL